MAQSEEEKRVSSQEASKRFYHHLKKTDPAKLKGIQVRNRERRKARIADDPEYATRWRALRNAAARRQRGTWSSERRKGKAKRSNIAEHGLTLAGFEHLKTAQNGLCAVCRKPETLRKRGVPLELSIDHDHATGKVRGLLCTSCNLGIGHLGDDPARLRAAAEYLERFR
jgi:hypothetical protein